MLDPTGGDRDDVKGQDAAGGHVHGHREVDPARLAVGHQSPYVHRRGVDLDHLPGGHGRNRSWPPVVAVGLASPGRCLAGGQAAVVIGGEDTPHRARRGEFHFLAPVALGDIGAGLVDQCRHRHRRGAVGRGKHRQDRFSDAVIDRGDRLGHDQGASVHEPVDAVK